jgi:hypothetical protein
MLELLVQTKLGPTQRRYTDTARRSAEVLTRGRVEPNPVGVCIG